MLSSLSYCPPYTPCPSQELEYEITSEYEKNIYYRTQEHPVLILIGGFQGSGKSSLIARITEVYDTQVISTDSIRQSLFNRGLEVSPEFSKCVSTIFRNLVIRTLLAGSNLVIDANSHSLRISQMEELLTETNPHYSTIKIFLSASETTLKNRINDRKAIDGHYQGTESDLEASLLSTKVNLDEYDLILDTDHLNQDNIFEQVNEVLLPYFSQH